MWRKLRGENGGKRPYIKKSDSISINVPIKPVISRASRHADICNIDNIINAQMIPGSKLFIIAVDAKRPKLKENNESVR